VLIASETISNDKTRRQTRFWLYVASHARSWTISSASGSAQSSCRCWWRVVVPDVLLLWVICFWSDRPIRLWTIPAHLSSDCSVGILITSRISFRAPVVGHSRMFKQGMAWRDLLRLLFLHSVLPRMSMHGRPYQRCARETESREFSKSFNFSFDGIHIGGGCGWTRGPRYSSFRMAGPNIYFREYNDGGIRYHWSEWAF